MFLFDVLISICVESNDIKKHDLLKSVQTYSLAWNFKD